MRRRGKVWAGLAPAILLLTALAGIRTTAQEPRAPSFLAEKYEVSTYVDTASQGINAIAKVEFRAQEVSQNVRVELHENLDVKEVKGPDGKQLQFQRENDNPLFVYVTLPQPIGARSRRISSIPSARRAGPRVAIDSDKRGGETLR